MSTRKNLLVFAALCAVLIISNIPTTGQDVGWPRQKVTNAGKVTYYQPQVDSWTNHKKVTFRTAMSVTPKGQPEAIGVAVMQASTDVDMDRHTVILHSLVVTDTNFPSLDEAAAKRMAELVRGFLPREASISISLERLVASVEKKEVPPTVEVRNDPPTIFTSERPAILVHIDGEPVFGKIKDTKLEFVVNSNFPVFLDRSKNVYHLFTGEQWLMATDPRAQWSKAAKLPKDMDKVKKDPQWAALGSVIPSRASATAAPGVFYSTTPAEVILFQGRPVYTAVPGTGLVFASNTDSDVFVHNPTQTFYYLAAGRWFRSNSLDGPWAFASADLPADFAKIPENTPPARVLASVPGTEQAKDAVLLAQVPTTAIVDAASAAASAAVTYTGPPDFKPIAGTSLSYAVNTAEKVVKVGDVYYLCLNGVWFFSSSPQGPWTTATSVPAAIYTIPPSSPVYNVTYVTQTTNSAGGIESSYTAGYLGTFVVGMAIGAVIANGSGYYYHPYFYYPPYGYPMYRPYAATYGVGAYYNHYTGGYGVARGVYGPYGGVVGRASYNPYTGTYARSVTAYGPYGSASVGRAYNPYTGTVARGGTVNTAYGSRTAAGAYNPYTGTAARTRQGSSAYGQWGTSVVSRGNQAVQTGHVSNSRGTVAGARSTSGAKAIGINGNYNSGGAIKTAGGDVYAGANGNVYRKTDSGWQQHNGNGWNTAGRPSQQGSSQTNRLNSEAMNRQRGAAQTRSYQRPQSTMSRPSMGSGGGGARMRAGGGGGRRR